CDSRWVSLWYLSAGLRYTTGLEHLEEAAFGFVIIGLDKGKTLTGDGLLGLFSPMKREQTLARNDLKGAVLPLRFHIATVNAYGEWPVRDREAAPLRRTAVDEGPLFVSQRVLQPLRHREH